jgi:hypothetical protein
MNSPVGLHGRSAGARESVWRREPCPQPLKMMVSSTAALANTYTFDSFVKLTASTGSITNPFQYTGRKADTETGIYYYRALF